jgi:hypothetical protein
MRSGDIVTTRTMFKSISVGCELALGLHIFDPNGGIKQPKHTSYILLRVDRTG